MSALRLLLLSILRRPGKGLVIFLGFGVCWTALFALLTLSDGAARSAQESARGSGQLLLLTPPVKTMNFTYGGVAVASGVTVEQGNLPGGLLEPLRKVGTLLPKRVVVGTVEQVKVLVAGVVLAEELAAKPHWHLQGSPSGKGFVIGTAAAERLQVRQGDTLRISLSNGKGLAGEVEALLEPTGGPEDQLVFADLPQVQQALGQERSFTFAEFYTMLPAEEAMAQASAVLGKQGKVTLVQDAKGARMELAESLSRFTLLVGAVVASLAASLLFVTLWSGVQERRKEWGIFFALGFRPNWIKGLILGEGISLAVLGSLAGSWTGYALALSFAPWVSAEPLQLVFPFAEGLWGLLFAGALAFLAGILPATKGASTDPVESFRQI